MKNAPYGGLIRCKGGADRSFLLLGTKRFWMGSLKDGITKFPCDGHGRDTDGRCLWCGRKLEPRDRN